MRDWQLLALAASVHGQLQHLLAIDALLDKYACPFVYIDVGSNIGLQLNRLYRPETIPENNDGFARVFDDAFGAAPGRNCHVCAIGVEPNPRHARRLGKMQESFNAAGAGLYVIKAAASTTDGGTLTFFTQAQRKGDRAVEGDQGASANAFSDARRGKEVQNLEDRISVPTVDLAQVIHRVRSRLARRYDREKSKIVIKIDIESSEYAVVPHLVVNQGVCVVDVILMEWHAKLYHASRLQLNPLKLPPKEQGHALLSGYIEMLEKWVSDTVAAPTSDCRTRLQNMEGNTMSRKNVRAFNATKLPSINQLCARA